MFDAVIKSAAVGFGMAALSLAWAGAAEAQSLRDRQVCYKTAEYDNGYTRVVLNVKFHSYLPTSSKYSAPQSVWEADGKHAYLEGNKNRMAVVDGAVVVSKGDSYQPKGAHLGLESIWVRGARTDKHLAPEGGPPKPIDWDCTSSDANPTPKIWYCSILTQQDGKVLPATLERLNKPDQYCDVFQDTQDYDHKGNR